MDDLDRDNEQFNQGVTHTVELLAKAVGVEDWVAGDGSEDYDDDLSQTLLNILIAKGLYSPDSGEFTIDQLRKLTALQAEDDALWAPGRTIGHAYCQQALRYLTRAIEGEWTFEQARDAIQEMMP